MPFPVDPEALRSFVVRLESVAEDPSGDGALGTGFFVAPGEILTCAHVVDGQAEVTVHPDPKVADRPHRAEVVAEFTYGHWFGVLWPFPDLALLRLTEPLERHPCALLHADVDRRPSTGVRCQAWGFPRRGEGRPGTAVSFLVEGTDGDGYLRLTGGQAEPGLSGAPLVCPEFRAVVGVMAATRQPNTDLGGWAAPVTALLPGTPGIPKDLAQLGAALLERNRRAVLADRMAWHRVLPVDRTGAALAQPWVPAGAAGPTPIVPADPTLPATPEQRRLSPAELLRPDFIVVPYLFRDEILQRAEAWCEKPGGMAVGWVTGRGGTGKTRFAIELCRRLSGKGWVAGFCRSDAGRSGRRIPDRSIAELPLPRLLVIDYLDAPDPSALRESLDLLSVFATPIAPVRVLLLSRSTPPAQDRQSDRNPLTDLLEDAPSRQLQEIFNAGWSIAEATARVPPERRRELFDTAGKSFRAAWLGASEPDATAANLTGRGDDPDLTDARYGRPLDVLFEALDQTLAAAPEPAESQLPAATRILRHEERYWAESAPREIRTLSPGLLRPAVALATLAGAADQQEADTLLAALPGLAGDAQLGHRHAVARWLARLYPTGTDLAERTAADPAKPLAFGPLQPDRLGEALIAEVLQDQPDGGAKLLTAVGDLPSDRQVARFLEVLCRLLGASPEARPAVIKFLLHRHGSLADRSLRSAPRSAPTALVGNLPHNFGQLLIAGYPGTHLEDLTGPRLRELGETYHQMGDSAARSGRSGVARELLDHAIAIRTELAGRPPTGRPPTDRDLERELSVSCISRADLALADGSYDRGRELYQKALAMRRQLSQDRPGNPDAARDLAVACNRLADLEFDAGSVDRAAQLYREAMIITVRLVAAQPADLVPFADLAICHERLADLALATGASRRARTGYQWSLLIRRQLVIRQPGRLANLRDLLITYLKLADLELIAGRLAIAWYLYRRALQIAELLDGREPDDPRQLRDLAVCWNRLAELEAVAGHIDLARNRYRQVLSIWQVLVTQEPDNPRLAQDLQAAHQRLEVLNERESMLRRSARHSLLVTSLASAVTEAQSFSVFVGKRSRIPDRIARLRSTIFPRRLTERRRKPVPPDRLQPSMATLGGLRDDWQLAFGMQLLGLTAAASGDPALARWYFSTAVALLRWVAGGSPRPVELTEDLGTALYLLASASTSEVRSTKREMIDVLAPLERRGKITSRGSMLLRWARS